MGAPNDSTETRTESKALVVTHPDELLGAIARSPGPLTMGQRRLYSRLAISMGIIGSVGLTTLGLSAGFFLLGPLAGVLVFLTGLGYSEEIREYLPPMLDSYRKEYQRIHDQATLIDRLCAEQPKTLVLGVRLEEVQDRSLKMAYEASRLALTRESALCRAETQGRIGLLNKALGSGKALLDHVAGKKSLDSDHVRDEAYRMSLVRRIDTLVIQKRAATGADRLALEDEIRTLSQERDRHDARVSRRESLDKGLRSVMSSLEELEESCRRAIDIPEEALEQQSLALIEEMKVDVKDLEEVLLQIEGAPKTPPAEE